MCQNTDLLGDFREILILAEDDSNVVQILTRKPDYIERDPHINAFFFAGKKCFNGPISKPDFLVPVTEWPGEYLNPSLAHDSKFAGPEMMPECVVARVRDAGIETSLRGYPRMFSADRLRKRQDIVIGKCVSESLSRGMKEVLAIHKHYASFLRWFTGH